MVIPSQLRDRYQIIQILEQRDLGATYLAEDIQHPLSQRCVIQKFGFVPDNLNPTWLIETQLHKTTEVWKRLKLAKALIPGLYAHFMENEAIYLVHEWVDGIPLKETIQTRGVWSQVAVHRFLKTLLPTLQSIHDQKILYRNLTPDTICLRRSDSEPVLININSFLPARAIASVYKFSDRIRSRTIAVATSGFTPSEQEAGKPVYASDIYSLGFTAIYLLTGKLPHAFQQDLHTGNSLWHNDVPTINSDLKNILETATAFHVRDRYQTAADFLQALEQIPEFSLPPSDSDIDSRGLQSSSFEDNYDPEADGELRSVDPSAIDDNDQSTSNTVSRPDHFSASSDGTIDDDNDQTNDLTYREERLSVGFEDLSDDQTPSDFSLGIRRFSVSSDDMDDLDDTLDDDDWSTVEVSRPERFSASADDTDGNEAFPSPEPVDEDAIAASDTYSSTPPEPASPPSPTPSSFLPPPSPPPIPSISSLPPPSPTPNTQRPTPTPQFNTTPQYTTVLLPSEPLAARVKRQIQGFFRALAGFWKKSDPVDCTVFSPATVSPGITFAVQVFTHRPEQTDVAKAIATDIDPNATRRGFKSLEINVKRGSRLTLCLHIPGLDIDNPVEYLVWNGRAASALFGVTVPAEASLGNYIGTLMVSHNQIPIGHVKFMVEVSAGTPSLQAAQPLGDVARRYHKAFISYASKDRTEVLKRVQMLTQMKINYFQDVLHLEPGDRWEKELYRHIDTSDLFLLFWSSSAKESRWVMKEVQYAIARKRGNELATPEIIPVIIEGPPPVAPPPELAHLHFNDRLIYFMNHSQ